MLLVLGTPGFGLFKGRFTTLSLSVVGKKLLRRKTGKMRNQTCTHVSPQWQAVVLHQGHMSITTVHLQGPKLPNLAFEGSGQGDEGYC